MASEKISQLTSGNPAQGTDLIPIARGGQNFSVTSASIAALATPLQLQVDGVDNANQNLLNFKDNLLVVWQDDGDGSVEGFFNFSGATGARFDGAGNPIVVTFGVPAATAADTYMVVVGYEYPLSNPGILSVEYVSANQFKIHSSSPTDASAVRYFIISLVS